MPYTTVVAGTTITAAYANANIRDQTLVPFANAAARDSAITVPVVGMVCWLTDTNTLWYYRGTAWRQVPGQTLYGMWNQTAQQYGAGLVGNRTAIYTTPDITLTASQAYDVKWQFAFGTGVVATLQGFTFVDVSTNSGGAWTTLSRTTNVNVTSSGQDLAPSMVYRYRPGVITQARFRINSTVSNTGIAIDYGSANTSSYFELMTTGLLSSEVTAS